MNSGNWGGGTSGVNGAVAANSAQSLGLLRGLLDDRHLTSYEMYYWIMLYEPDTRGGWGDFPTPDKPAPLSDVNLLNDLKNFYAGLKAADPRLKVGLYVNCWAAWENSRVYTLHPTWFRSRSMANDGGGTAYWGKLPEWGQHLYDPAFTPAEASIPEMITAYDLDFVFFDNGGDFTDALSGDVTQMRTFYTNLIQAVHNAGAITISNGLNPYMDITYIERVTGQTSHQDNFFVDSFEQMVAHPRMIAPLNQRLGDDYLSAIPAFFNNGWTNEPGFVPYWPVHFGSPDYDFVLDGYGQWADILRSRHHVADIDADYYVDYTDFSIFSLDWMDCTDPQNSVDCITWP